MNTGTIIALIIVVALVLIGFWLWNRRREQEAIREQFGPEYERTLAEVGDRGKAVDELSMASAHPRFATGLNHCSEDPLCSTLVAALVFPFLKY